MKAVIDTNVVIVANERAPHASMACVHACAERLLQFTQSDTLVLDAQWLILNEYMRYYEESNPSRQMQVGDLFLKWVMNNWRNPTRCELVPITEHETRGFDEFPDDPALQTFDRSDRKFVAVALTSPGKPPILNAVDTDWRDHYAVLATHQLKVEFLCPDVLAYPENR